MPRYQNVVNSFASGIWSPRASLRADSEKYDNSCRKCDNFIITPQGGATLRNGTKFIGSPRIPSQPFRVFTLGNGGDISDVVVEMTEGINRYWQDDALIEDPPSTPIQSANPYLNAELPLVRFDSQENLFVTTHPARPPHYTTLTGAGNPIDEPIPFDRVPQQRFNDLKSISNISRITVYTIVFVSNWNDGDPFWFVYDGAVNNTGGSEPTEIEYLYSTTPSSTVSALEAAANANPVMTQSQISVAHVSGTTYTITVDGTTSGRVLLLPPQNSPPGVTTITATSGEINTGEEPAWSYPFVVLNNANYYQCIQPHESATDTEPGVGASWQTVWVDLGTTAPPYFAYQFPSGNAWQQGQLYGVWDRGWPRTLAFHEQRLWFGGTVSLPAGLWASRVANYNDFVAGPNDADPISIVLTTRGTPLIQWMESQKGLLLGTSAGEYRVTSEGAISPSNIDAEKQNNSRASFANPISIDYETFYIELGKTKVRATRYMREALGYVSTDISLVAENVFYPRAKRMALMQTPEMLGFVLLENRNLLTLSYVRSEEMGAWATHSMRNAIDDMTTAFSVPNNEDELYVVARRGDAYRLEKLVYPRREFTSFPREESYFDSYVTGTGAISGLDHLEGQTVGVTDNNAWVGEFTVVSGSVPYTPAGLWAVGLTYKGILETQERTDQSIEFGTSRRWNKLYVRLLDSAYPLVNGYRYPDRDQDGTMDIVTPLKTMDVKSVNLGFGDGSVRIEQNRPFPTHIIGIYGQYGTNNA